MRTLLLDRLPDVSTATKTDPDRALNGVKVNDAAFVQALLKYGTYDVYYYVRESISNKKADDYCCSDRLRPLDVNTLELLATNPPQELILFTSSHHLAKFVPFREFCGHMEWPVCGLIHGLSSNTLIPSYMWNYFAALQSYDAIICTTRSGKQALAKIFQGLAESSSVCGFRDPVSVKMPIIPLGIDPSPITRSDISLSKDDTFLIVSIGRLSASHKADLRPLIAAFLGVNNLSKNSTLVLAGDDTQDHVSANLQEFANGFQSSRKVIVMPDISAGTKSALLQMADVALCMSDTYQETFGLSVLEAMDASLPVVAPCWDGYRDLVVDEVTGFLAPTYAYEDTTLINAISMLVDPAFALSQRIIIDLDSMLKSLSILSTNKKLAKEMGRRAKARVQQLFSWETVIKEYESLWDKLITEGKSACCKTPPVPQGFLNYGHVFSSYPQGTITLDTTIVWNENANRFLSRELLGDLFSAPPIAGFSDDLDRRILELCRKYREVAIGELTGMIVHGAVGRSAVITQISRLVKYGLLSFKSSTKPELITKEQDNEITQSRAYCESGI